MGEVGLILKMSKEFDLKKIYTQVLSKEKLIEVIRNTFNKKFQVIFLPIEKDKADILIRDIRGDSD